MVVSTVIMESQEQEPINVLTLESVEGAFGDIVFMRLENDEDADEDDFDFPFIDPTVDFGVPYRLRFDVEFPEELDTQEFKHWFNARALEWKPMFALLNHQSPLVIREIIEQPVGQDGGKKKKTKKTCGGKRRSSKRRTLTKKTTTKRTTTKRRSSGGKRRRSLRRRI